MSVGGVPALQLEGLGGRNTPRSSTASRQQTLQRVFKGLDDDEDARRPSVATSTVPPAMNSSRRSSASFRRLDDDEDSPRPSIAAKISAPATSLISSTTPRASRDEIERRRKVMFDSEEEDTPRGPQATRNKVQAPLPSHPEREAPSRAKASSTQVQAGQALHSIGTDAKTTKTTNAAPLPSERDAPSRAKVPAPASGPRVDKREEERDVKSQKPSASALPVVSSTRAPSPRIGSWRQESPNPGGRTPRAEMQRRQARQAQDDSDSDDYVVARDAMPSTSPLSLASGLSLAPTLNGTKKKTYGRHASPAPRTSPSPPKSMPNADAKAAPEPATANVDNFAAALFSVPQAKPLLKSDKTPPQKEKTPPPAATATADDSLTNERLSAKIVALEKEMKDIRSQIQERPQTKEGPTAAQYERLQQELRDQKSEMKDMRSQMDAMQRQLKEMSLRFDQTSSPNKSPQDVRGRGNYNNAVVSAEVVPLHSMPGIKTPSMLDSSLASLQQKPGATRSTAPPPPEPESAHRPANKSVLPVDSSVLKTPAPADSSVLKTPAPKLARINKAVTVQRQPIPGAQVSQSDKVGIGISFGMTAKGDVFITGMAPNGPAKASGQVKRGDQLVAVDGTDIKGWDVKDIVGLIVGPQGSDVRLVVASLPEGDSSSPSALSPRFETPNATARH